MDKFAYNVSMKDGVMQMSLLFVYLLLTSNYIQRILNLILITITSIYYMTFWKTNIKSLILIFIIYIKWNTQI